MTTGSVSLLRLSENKFTLKSYKFTLKSYKVTLKSYAKCTKFASRSMYLFGFLASQRGAA